MSAVLLWGWDRGNHIYRKVLVNPTGYLQAVIMSSLLPAGAATEVTLDLVRAELDGIEGLLAGGLPAALATGALKVREQNWPADPSTGGRQDLQTDLISLIRILLAARLPAALDATGGLKVANLFGGSVYVNSDTAASDAARRFETSAKKLRDVVIIVKTYAQLFGDSSGQTYPVAVNGTIGFTKVDISTLYFKNTTAGENGVVHILGTEE